MPAPRRASSRTSAAVAPRSGSPALRNGMNAVRFSERSRANSASMGFMSDLLAAQARHLEAVLVAAAGEADDDDVVLRPPGGDAHGLDHRVGRLQGGEDALQARTQVEAAQGVV